jgi:hypothetical protein
MGEKLATGSTKRKPNTYEKHRAPSRVPRAGVNGGSAPDSLRVIKNHDELIREL